MAGKKAPEAFEEKRAECPNCGTPLPPEVDPCYNCGTGKEKKAKK